MNIPSLILATAVTLVAAHAQGTAQTLTPAPVPNRGPAEIAPAERAGRPDGSERAAPFSGLPNSVGAGAGQDTPATTGSPQTQTAPAPSLSR